MATDWRWPPDSKATGTEGSCTVVTPSSLKAVIVRLRIARLLVNTRPRRISRPRNTLAAASRCGAKARSWYTVSIPIRWASSGEWNVTGTPSRRICAVVGRMDP